MIDKTKPKCSCLDWQPNPNGLEATFDNEGNAYIRGPGKMMLKYAENALKENQRTPNEQKISWWGREVSNTGCSRLEFTLLMLGATVAMVVIFAMPFIGEALT